MNYVITDKVWNVDSLYYTGNNFHIGSESNNIASLHFSNDGLKFFILDVTNDSVYQYSVFNAWSISACSYDGIEFYVGSEAAGPNGIFFSTDGGKMFCKDGTTKKVYQYTLLTPWDISVVSYDGVEFSVLAEDPNVTKIFFKKDGTKMYTIGYTTDKIFQYSVLSAWNMDTATYDGVEFYVGSTDNNPYDMFISENGNKLYSISNGDDSVFQYTLPTPWDISVVSYDGINFYVGSEDIAPHTIFFDPSGLRIYMAGRNTDYVYEYVVSSAVPIYPNFDYVEEDAKIEDRYRMKGGDEYVYRWGGIGKRKFSLSFTNSNDASIVNNMWKNNSKLSFISFLDSSVFSCQIVNSLLPMGSHEKPYKNLFRGVIELESY